MRFNRPFLRFALISVAYATAFAAEDAKAWVPDVPKTWDETQLVDWATPVAGLNVRPSHISPDEYYSMPVENYRSYPVYMPGREPEGYWEMLQHIGPKPLIESATLKTQADWIKAGQRVFEEATLPQLTTFDSGLIAPVRNREFMERQGAKAFADGTLDFLRWVPTERGLALAGSSCSACHVLHRTDGSHVPGAPGRADVSRTRTYQFRSVQPRYLEGPNHVLGGAPPFFMGGGGPGAWLSQAYGVPWVRDDENERLKSATTDEYEKLTSAYRQSGGVIRWNGSLLYPAKIPDLIGIQDRRFIDHTATHLHRGIGDLMRYAAQVSFAEITDFGPYHMLSAESKRVQTRLPDEALYALALYIYSLRAPPNPNHVDQKAKAGQRIFARDGCIRCHTPPLYTSNKLTLAIGFTPPEHASPELDILPISVGTDSGLALKTRKGTGYYKIPSLKGLWYRGHYLHDGSAASLEEMFDPDRLKETHVPGGWLPVGALTHAIPGHQFGLNLKPEERAQLIAFLRTL
jgi:mono/diheme cytochrome c family protein